MKRKLVCAIIGMTMAASLLAGCGGSSDSTATDETAAEDDGGDEEAEAATGDVITVGYAQVGHESDWRMANTQNYYDVFSAENGYDLQLIDCDNDNAAQIEAVRSFIQQELDYIVIAPIETAGWDTVLQEAEDAGIPVIIADREIDADNYDAWVGTNTVNEGITAGNWLGEYLDGADANILVIEGSVGASATLGRTEGFDSVLAEHPEWTKIDQQSGDFTQSGGQEVMESFIKSYEGQFNVVVCQNDNEAYGAMDAMDAAGITYGVDGDVIIISFDATHDGLQYTLDGKINCDVECNPIQAETVAEVIQLMAAGQEYPESTLVDDEAFVAPGIESAYATTMTQEILDGRAY
ncbi:MAG: ABC transporter substrate-binding protein [Clostridiales bacterium]|nr:ABC transporter substrate-binding protein [Clostridiales bacterium]